MDNQIDEKLILSRLSWQEFPQTKAAVSNFGQGHFPQSLRRAMLEVKQAALSSAQELYSLWEGPLYKAILTALDLLKSNNAAHLFPLSLEQGGAGTSINMNINEAAAACANALLKEQGLLSSPIDPLKHINIFQSTNDVFPTAVTIVTIRGLAKIEEACIRLQEELSKRENLFGDKLITGRTQLQDALPMTLGQVFGGWAGAIARDRWRLSKLKERLRDTALGGTALGTCFSAPADYIFLAEEKLRRICSLSLSRSQNFTDEISNQDKYSELAGAYRICAENLFKIASDLSLYSASFLGEIKHPDLQYGSTIMASKTNPVMLELIRGLALSLQGEAQKVGLYAQNGQLQLNPFLPFTVQALINMEEILFKAQQALINLLPRLEFQKQKAEKTLFGSRAILNALLPLLGYQKIKQLAPLLAKKQAMGRQDFLDFLKEQTSLNQEELKEFLDPYLLTSAARNLPKGTK